MKKIQNKMHTLGERIQEYGVRISSFYLFQLNDSTSQHLNTLVFSFLRWCYKVAWRLIIKKGVIVFEILEVPTAPLIAVSLGYN